MNETSKNAEPTVAREAAGYAALAEEVEMDAARRAYAAGLGVGEWEAFLTLEQRVTLEECAAHGAGTWGRERAA